MPDRFLTHRSRRHASIAMRAPDPGRYLAVDDGAEVVLLALRAGMTRIGRSSSADVAFDDGSVSRRHAVVMTRSDGSAEVLDDGSLNGTFVNGERVRRRVLRHGDTLTIGRRTLRYLDVKLRRSPTPLDQPTEEITPSVEDAVSAAVA
jgi:pSer/pThr/pTyr-binding forkhead associated (FHA) protein